MITTLCQKCWQRFTHRPAVARKFCSLECAGKVSRNIDAALLDERQKAYLAGFFDGEGCIHGYFTHPRNGRRMGSTKVTVVCGNLEVLMFGQKLFGGSINKRVFKEKPKWNDALTWHLGTKETSVFLRAVLPYLIVKRQEAEVALELWELANHPNRGSRKLPEDVINKRSELVAKLCSLKSRNKVAA